MVGENQSQGGGGPRLSANRVFKLLVARHRRAILRALAHHDDKVAIDQLIDESLVHSKGLTAKLPAYRSRMLKQCCHVHLPKLADAGVIEYWPQEGLVEPKPAIEIFQPILELAEPYEKPLDV